MCLWIGCVEYVGSRKENAKGHLAMLNSQLMRYGDEMVFITITMKHVFYRAGLETQFTCSLFPKCEITDSATDGTRLEPQVVIAESHSSRTTLVLGGSFCDSVFLRLGQQLIQQLP